MLPGEAFKGENITDENCIRYAGGWKLKESPCIC